MEKADISVIVGEHLLNYRVSAIIKKENKCLLLKFISYLSNHCFICSAMISVALPF